MTAWNVLCDKEGMTSLDTHCDVTISCWHLGYHIMSQWVGDVETDTKQSWDQQLGSFTQDISPQNQSSHTSQHEQTFTSDPLTPSTNVSFVIGINNLGNLR